MCGKVHYLEHFSMITWHSRLCNVHHMMHSIWVSPSLLNAHDHGNAQMLHKVVLVHNLQLCPFTQAGHASTRMLVPLTLLSCLMTSKPTACILQWLPCCSNKICQGFANRKLCRIWDTNKGGCRVRHGASAQHSNQGHMWAPNALPQLIKISTTAMATNHPLRLTVPHKLDPLRPR